MELLDKYFKMFPGLKSAIDNSKAKLHAQGYVEDILGRRRRLPDISLPKYEVKEKTDPANPNPNFNPFMECSDRLYSNDKVIAWQQKVKEAIAKSQSWQKKKALEAGADWKDNGEMSNSRFEALAKEALKDNIVISANTGRIAQAERQCFNARIQGSAGSLTKKAMLEIFNDEQLRAWDTHLIITVHDEVLVECKEEYADLVEQRLPELMIKAAVDLGITEPKMKCDPYQVSRWYAPEMAATILKEFNQFKAGNEKKGIAPLNKEDAMHKVITNHIELPKEAIINVLTGKTEALEF